MTHVDTAAVVGLTEDLTADDASYLWLARKFRSDLVTLTPRCAQPPFINSSSPTKPAGLSRLHGTCSRR